MEMHPSRKPVRAPFKWFKTKGGHSPLSAELPFPLQMFLRLIVLFVLRPIMVIAVILSLGAHHQIYFTRLSSAATPGAWIEIAWLCAILGVHFLYLRFLLNDYVFAFPAADYRWRHLVFPTLLTLAYASGWIMPHFTQLVFIATYGFWLIDEAFEYLHLRENDKKYRIEKNSETRQLKLWLIIDGFIVTVLSIMLAMHIESPLLYDRLSTKDLVIFLDLIGYTIVWLSNIRLLAGTHDDDYKQIQKNLTEGAVTPCGKNLEVLRDLLTARLARRTTAGGGASLTSVDLGSASAIRSEHFLKALAVPGKDITRYAIDVRRHWAEEFVANMDNRYARSIFVQANVGELSRATGPGELKIHDQPAQVNDELANPDLVICSHILHDRDMAWKVNNYLKQVPEGCVVIVIGCDYNHFLHHLMNESAMMSVWPRLFYRWKNRHLRIALDESVELSEYDYSSWQPIARTSETLRLSVETARRFSLWIETHYGRKIGLRTRRILEHEVRNRRLETLNFDGIVYAFIKVKGRWHSMTESDLRLNGKADEGDEALKIAVP